MVGMPPTARFSCFVSFQRSGQYFYRVVDAPSSKVLCIFQFLGGGDAEGGGILGNESVQVHFFQMPLIFFIKLEYRNDE